MELLGKILTWCEGPPYTRDDLVRGIHDWIVSNAKSDDLLAEWTALLPADSPLAPGRAYRTFRRLRLLWLWQKVSPIVLYFFGRRLRSDYLVAGTIGSEDFQRLIVAQGFEHGVLEEIEFESKWHGHKQIAYGVVGEPIYDFQLRRLEEV